MMDNFTQIARSRVARRLGILGKIGTRSALLLFAVLSVGLLSAGSRTLAVDHSSEVASATPESGGVLNDNSEQESLAAGASVKEEHGLSQKAEEITSFLGFPITNSMIVSWIVALRSEERRVGKECRSR